MGEPPGQAAKAPEHAEFQSREDLAVLVRLGGVVLRGDTAKFLRSQAMARDISVGAGRVSRSQFGKGFSAVDCLGDRLSRDPAHCHLLCTCLTVTTGLSIC